MHSFLFPVLQEAADRVEVAEVAQAADFLLSLIDFDEMPSKLKLISNLGFKSNLMIFVFFYFQLYL